MSFDNYFSPETGILGTTRDGVTFDEGDGAQKMGLLRFGRYLSFKNDKEKVQREEAKYAQELDALESPERKGWYVRSPAIGKLWWKNPYCFSRDQFRSTVIAMGALKQRKRLLRLVWEHVKRLGFHQNIETIDGENELPDILVRIFPKLKGKQMPDVTSPDAWGEILRALIMAFPVLKVLYPVLFIILCVTDLFALGGLLLSFNHWKNPDEADDDNMIMSYLQAKYAIPTPISLLTRKIYKHYRPAAGFTDDTKVFPLTKQGRTGAFMAICWKHRPSEGAPPFGALYLSILEKEL